ncbi:MAG: glycoside hydrolase family 31 protein [Bacteroidales bacterium]|nr:glycoside hydrolase family 31 protein [Bacteroidales bacterium]
MTKKMLLKISIIATIMLTIATFGIGQSGKRIFNNLQDLQGKIIISVSDGRYEIIPYNDKIVHTTFYPKDKEIKNFSFAVDMEPEEVSYYIDNKENIIDISINKLKVIINKSPFQISYYYKDKLLIAENKGYVTTDTSQILDFSISKDEILYGGGARVLGMNRRGNRLKLYNQAHYGYGTHSELMNYSLPVFLSSKQYAVLFDNASAGFMDLDSKKNNSLNYETATGTMNYFVIAGTDWYDLVAQYTNLTGYQPLPPRWAFGCFSSRFGYHSQAETEATVDKFFEKGIPLEAIILDIYWFGKDIKGTLGNLEWYRDSFPEPEKMIAKFKEKGVKTILITEPFVLTTSDRWDEAVKEKVLATDSTGQAYKFDFYFGNGGLIDVFDEKARDWYWNIYKKFTNQGVEGWWGDLGEPEMHPADIQHKAGTGDEIHNAYGHEWAGIIYEGYKKDFPEKRPFILMRAGYAGSQRYGMIPWTGDVSRSWDGLIPQPEISLQMGMQGIAYMHSDLGGFAGDQKIEPELYTRWLQYGVFQPIYRPHAQEAISPEPAFQVGKTLELAKKSIDLRYRLMPYIYNMAFENSRSGKPLMIPLFFNETDNPMLLTYDKAYMWGDAFLVSPVKAKGKKRQKVYLPKSTHWTDFNTGKVYPGGEELTVPLAMEHIPVFVKGGSFIPMIIKAVNESNYSLDKFELHYFVDPQVNKSAYQLYNDDGKTAGTFDAENFELFNFTAINTEQSLTVNFEKTTSVEHYQSIENEIFLVIHNLTKVPKRFIMGGKELKATDWKWNTASKLLSVKVKCSLEKGKLEILK